RLPAGLATAHAYHGGLGRRGGAGARGVDSRQPDAEHRDADLPAASHPAVAGGRVTRGGGSASKSERGRPPRGPRRSVWRTALTAVRYFNIAIAALWPGAPITPPPGCAPLPHRNRPSMGVR